MTTMELSEKTVGELAVDKPASIRIFEQWNIDYCCGGRTPLSVACAAAGKTIDDFEQALANAAVPAADSFDWASESLTAVAGKIMVKYHVYTREELATLQPLAARVLGVHGARHPELTDVASLVRDLTTDLLPHMEKEERVLFPYVDELEREGAGAPPPFFGTVKNPVRMMMMEHDRVGDLLSTLRHVTTNYSVPGDACFSYRELYRRLAEFESLTHEHIHVENNAYFPRAVALEERLG